MAFDRERFMRITYGHATSEWESTREWLLRRLHRVARDRAMITYSDLANDMARAGVLRLEPHSSAMAGLLGQVNLLEHEAGRPLISALVIHKGGDLEPGSGFWEFAKDLGIDPGASADGRLVFWTRELERCYSRWAED
jgi:hypothetical protein